MVPDRIRSLLGVVFAAVLAACGGGGGGTGGAPPGKGDPPPGNRPPVATTLDVVARVGTARTVVLDGSDPDGDAVTYRIVDAPWHGGEVTLSGNTVTYTPAADAAVGDVDSFTYLVNDGWTDATYEGYVFVTLQDASANAAPQALDAMYWTPPATPLAIVLPGSDADGDPLTFTVGSGPSHGALSGTGASRTYTPAAGFVGTDAFTISVGDGHGSIAARVTISVAPRPSFRDMSEAERTAAMEALAAKEDELGGLASDEAVRVLESFARGLAGVAHVASDPSGVFGQFADGVSFFVGVPPVIGVDPDAPATTSGAASAGLLPSRPLPPTSGVRRGGARSARSSAAIAAPAPATAAGALPRGAKAVLFNTFPVDSYWGPNPTGELSTWLQDAGYTVEVRAGRVSDFTIDAASVVHVRTHGGHGIYFSRDDEAAGEISSLWTATPSDETTRTIYRDDLLSGHLTLMREKVSPDAKAWHIGIAPKFILREWTLAPGAYVHLSSCWLGERGFYNPRAGPYTPPISILQKAVLSTGAQLFAGWTRATEVVHLDKVARYVFDRLLGANRAAPVESPPQRPMGALSISKDLTAKGLDLNSVEQGSGWTSVFRFQASPSSGSRFPVDRLAPSIEYVQPDPATMKLRLFGDFTPFIYDSTSLRVSIDGTEYPATVTADGLECSLPADASGDVRVLADGRKSNRVRLSRWSGTFRYTVTGPGDLSQEWSYPVTLVGDVHAYREGAGLAPVRSEDAFLVMLPGRSSGTYTVSGSAQDAEHRVTWSGGGSLSPNVTPTECDGCFAFDGNVMPGMPGAVWWDIFVGVQEAYQQVLSTWDLDHWQVMSEGAQAVMFPFFSGMQDTATPGTSMFALRTPGTLREDGTIQGGAIGPESMPSTGLGSFTGWSFQHEFRWPTLTPVPGSEIDPAMPR